MLKIFNIFLFICVLSHNTSAQAIDSYGTIKDAISLSAKNTNSAADNVLVSGRAMNFFIQKKVSTYLAGSSQISLSKLYATYAGDNDKLAFGFNYEILDSSSQRLIGLLNPLIETNMKNNFATLYKKGDWQADIRVGLKYSYILNKGIIKFYGLQHSKDQKSKMITKRSDAAQAILSKIDKEAALLNSPLNQIIVESKAALKAKYETELLELKKLPVTPKTLNRTAEIRKILISLERLPARDEINYPKKLNEYRDELAKAELDLLYERGAYNTFSTSWISVWGFYPVTEKKSYMSTDNSIAFEPQKFKLWELNAQYNFLHEGRKGIFFVTPGLKVFQNNTAVADLMTPVDYNQYLQFPGVDTANAAILETNKAYIGAFKEFITSNVNLQLVLSLSDKKQAGGEKFLTPGISVRIEKNFGDYSALNWRFGFPLRFKGKDSNKAINIEPQVRLNNTGNYAKKVDFKQEPLFGINVGLPFTPLFK